MGRSYTINKAIRTVQRLKGTSKNTKNSPASPALSAKQRIRSVRASFPLFAGRFASSACPTGAL